MAFINDKIMVKIDNTRLVVTEYHCSYSPGNYMKNIIINSEFNICNDNSGVIWVNINIVPIMPPQRKRKLPFYNQSNLCLLEDEADQLEKLGALAKPEDIGIDVKYVSTSFLSKSLKGHIVL